MKNNKKILFNEDKTMAFYIVEVKHHIYRIVRYSTDKNSFLGWSDCYHSTYLELTKNKYLNYDEYMDILDNNKSPDLEFHRYSKEADKVRAEFIKRIKKYQGDKCE